MTSLFGVLSGPVLLVVCVGEAHEDDAEHAAKAMDIRILTIDKALKDSHNVLHPSVQRELIRLCDSDAVASAHFGTDCRSFSPLNADLALRPPGDPTGSSAPYSFRTYIDQQNAVIDFCALLVALLMRRERPFTWENSPSLFAPGTPWHWPEMAARVSSIWDTPWILALEARFDLTRVTAPMCMLGGRFRKYFTLLIPRCMLPTFSWLVGLVCPGVGAHAEHEPAWGMDDLGRSRATLAGRYPLDMHYLIFSGHVSHGPQGELSCVSTVGQSANLSLYPSDNESASVDAYMPVSDVVGPLDLSQTPFGSVSFGHRLSPPISEAIRAASSIPAGFSSYRNRDRASHAELQAAPLPSVRNMALRLAQEAGPRPPQDPSRLQWDGISDWRSLVTGAPSGNITLAVLIGHAKQAAWRDYLRRYQLAFDAVLASLSIPNPGEFVILQEELPTWASPFVWRARAHDDYLPVTRSTRHTYFPGRMMDRDRMRDVAAELQWEKVDPDILSQACEGGCELRTDAPLHTTAAWHHPGVSTHFQVADDIVRAERAKKWTYTSDYDMEYVPSV